MIWHMISYASVQSDPPQPSAAPAAAVASLRGSWGDCCRRWSTEWGGRAPAYWPPGRCRGRAGAGCLPSHRAWALQLTTAQGQVNGLKRAEKHQRYLLVTDPLAPVGHNLKVHLKKSWGCTAHIPHHSVTRQVEIGLDVERFHWIQMVGVGHKYCLTVLPTTRKSASISGDSQRLPPKLESKSMSVRGPWSAKSRSSSNLIGLSGSC
jgi:hypothetical protein